MIGNINVWEVAMIDNINALVVSIIGNINVFGGFYDR